MYKVIENGELIEIILNEKEKWEIASDKAKAFLSDRIKNIDKYVINEEGLGECFFLGGLVGSDDYESESGDIPSGTVFNVGVDGKVYKCIFNEIIALDNRNMDEAAFEAYITLLWMYKHNDITYEQWMGVRVDDDGNLYHQKDCLHSEYECSLKFAREMGWNREFVQMELTDNIKEMVRKLYLMQYTNSYR